VRLKRSRWAARVLLAGLAVVVVGCSSNRLPFNDTPVISGLFPSNVTAGSQTFTLFITGTGFIANAKGVSFAYWNGLPRSSTLNVNTGQLAVTIVASDVANIGIAQVTVVNPPPGGGTSSASSFTIVAAQPNGPVISSLSPASASLNGQAFTLNVTGINFAAGDVVTWNGGPRATTFTSQNQVSATIGEDDISQELTAGVSVSSPGLVDASPSVSFPVNGAASPVPSLGSITPSSAVAGSSDLEVTIKGSGYAMGSTAEWNGVPLATAFISSGQLVAILPATDLATAGTANITVTTPAPGGGTSRQLTFTVSGS
jgi:IPT/TIG domain